jgi:hypothetical protein
MKKLVAGYGRVSPLEQALKGSSTSEENSAKEHLLNVFCNDKVDKRLTIICF